jgi:hypothetical protein
VRDPGENEGWQGDVRSGIDDVVEFLECEGCPFRFLFGGTDTLIAGNEDLSLNAREGLGEDGDRRRFLVFERDGRKWFVLLLAYASIEAFGPGKIFGWVSPDVQGILWAWGCRCSDAWGGWWGGRGSIIGGLAMWFVVGCIGELLAHFLEFCSDAR